MFAPRALLLQEVVAFVLHAKPRVLRARRPSKKGRPMKQFVTEESFWELFPEAQIGIVEGSQHEAD